MTHRGGSDWNTHHNRRSSLESQSLSQNRDSIDEVVSGFQSLVRTSQTDLNPRTVVANELAGLCGDYVTHVKDRQNNMMSDYNDKVDLKECFAQVDKTIRELEFKLKMGTGAQNIKTLDPAGPNTFTVFQGVPTICKINLAGQKPPMQLRFKLIDGKADIQVKASFKED